MPIILFLNIKGGVAKTTTSVGVAEALASMGRRVLFIDADHQCAASELLLGEHRLMNAERGKKTFHDLLAAMLEPGFSPPRAFGSYVSPGGSTIDPVQKDVSVIPCSFRINDFVRNRAKAKKEADPEPFERTWESHLAALRAWINKMYDITIVDCPPSLALQVRFLLRVCDGFVIPCVPDRISVRGVRYLLEETEKSKYKAVPLGIVWTLYREQNNRHKIMASTVGKSAGKPGPFVRLPTPVKTIVPNATAIVAAHEGERKHRSLAHKYTNEFAHLFERLAEEIETRTAIALGKAARG